MRWFANACAVVLLTMAPLAAVACCAVQPGDAPETAIDAFHVMQQRERAGDFEALVDAMTEHGYGSLAEEAATVLLWGAGAQPIDPTQGEPFQALLEAYDLMEFRFWYREWLQQEGRRGARVWLSRRFAEDRASFLRDSLATLNYPSFEAFSDPEFVQVEDDVAVLNVLDREAYEEGGRVEMRFVLRGNTWLFDGLLRPSAD